MKSQVIQYLIENGAGRTAIELARAVYGDKGYQQRVNPECEALAVMGTVERRGAGGPGDPFKYYPVVTS